MNRNLAIGAIGLAAFVAASSAYLRYNSNSQNYNPASQAATNSSNEFRIDFPLLLGRDSTVFADVDKDGLVDLLAIGMMKSNPQKSALYYSRFNGKTYEKPVNIWDDIDVQNPSIRITPFDGGDLKLQIAGSDARGNIVAGNFRLHYDKGNFVVLPYNQ